MRRTHGQGRLALLALAAVLLGVAVTCCGGPEPIRIGFAGQLIGAYSDGGVNARNGAQLAVEHINAAGGIQGRPLELVVRDDRNSLGTALAVDRELSDMGVVAVIGHMTSTLCAEVVPYLADMDLILISPTSSTPELAGIDDLFFRVTTPTDVMARGLARYAARDMGLDRVFVVLDLDNAGYSEPYTEYFSASFQEAGGEIAGVERFASSGNADWESVTQALRRSGSQGLLVVASPRDTAALARHLSAQGLEPALLVSPWSMNPALPRDGGSSVEGAVSCHDYAEDMRLESLVSFRNAFQERFGLRPSHPAITGYEAVQILARALEETGGSRQGLEQALGSIRDFPGVLGPVTMDDAGDVVRPTYIIAIKQGVITLVAPADS